MVEGRGYVIGHAALLVALAVWTWRGVLEHESLSWAMTPLFAPVSALAFTWRRTAPGAALAWAVAWCAFVLMSWQRLGLGHVAGALLVLLAAVLAGVHSRDRHERGRLGAMALGLAVLLGIAASVLAYLAWVFSMWG